LRRYTGGVSAALLALLLAQEPALDDVLRRLSEEAEVFSRVAPKVIGQEVLQQKARRPPPRFRPRIGQSALKPPPARYQTREIVSEYGYSTFQESSEALHEFRQVVSVDGRTVASSGKARKLLIMGVTSADDKLKNRLLRDFEKYGLHGSATDLAPLLLLFTRRQLENYDFAADSEELIGAERTRRFAFRQKSGAAAITIFSGREAHRLPLEGHIWVRASDGLPVRIRLRAAGAEKETAVERIITVDYVLSPHGVLLPVSVLFVESMNGETTVENSYAYRDFKMFKVESELKFTVEETPPR
jgi:hypothetical protein